MAEKKKRAIVFWDGLGHFWIEQAGTERHGPFTSDESLDEAITDAKANGYVIAGVQRTRGTLPAWQPKAQA